MAVAGRVSSICVIVGWVVISGMCASAELPGVISMAAAMVVVVVGMVEGDSAVCILGYRICYSNVADEYGLWLCVVHANWCCGLVNVVN